MIKELSLITIAVMSTLMAAGVVVKGNQIRDSIKSSQPTNISEYLKLQDDKIATLSAQIATYKENVAKLEDLREEDRETFDLALEYISESDNKKMWDRWSVEVCPKYELEWYCKGDN